MPLHLRLAHPASSRPRSGSGRSRWVWGLVLALLWAQMLGLVHSVRHVHGPGPGAGHAVHATRSAHEGAVHGGHASRVAGGHHHHGHAHAGGGMRLSVGVLGHLHAPADDAQDCRLYDQLGHAGPVSAPFGLWVHALPRVPAWVVLQALQPRTCVSFAARAPPASR